MEIQNKFTVITKQNVIDNNSNNLHLFHTFDNIINWNIITYYINDVFGKQIMNNKNQRNVVILYDYENDLMLHIYSFNKDNVKISVKYQDITKKSNMITIINDNISIINDSVMEYIKSKFPNYYLFYRSDKNIIKTLKKYSKFNNIRYDNVYKFLGINYRKLLKERKMIID
jgi:hypothetical protein